MPEVQSIDKIEMINFEYYAVERRGIEIELTLNIEYQTQEDIISDIDIITYDNIFLIFLSFSF